MPGTGRSASGLAALIPVAVLLGGCGTPDGDTHADGPARGGTCQRFESFSGQLVVGNPDAAPPTRVLVPVEPGAALPQPPDLPSLVSIGVDREPGRDSVVLELGGDGTTGWAARFVQMPLLRGTDDPVAVPGACILQVDLTGIDPGQPGEGGGPTRITPDGDATSPVVEVLSYPTGDGVKQVFVGTRSGAPEVTVGSVDARRAITITISS
ncbi:hypothetical protein ACFWPA_05255 [Rhodococcus sp. NPDC058505]|uniref:AMIN-like domain-containing (lipo)protein n=1 Tax=unclassified Rhodococcus (in: high G+C Gram-positive bacteria) TaxID=192944 RepID=UPI003646E1E8